MPLGLKKTLIVGILTVAGAIAVFMPSRLYADDNGNLHTSILTSLPNANLSIRNIDVTRFPEITLLLDAEAESRDLLLTSSNIEVFENHFRQQLLSVEKIVTNNRTSVDFVFVLDKTGSMKDKIDEVHLSIDRFIQRMVERGINYRLGLVTFGDRVESVSPMTDNVDLFKLWLNKIVADGGGDDPENALEALRTASDVAFRTGASRMALLITDAPCHQRGENGDGRTDLTSGSCALLMNATDVRTFCITDPDTHADYDTIAYATGGAMYDINQPFDDILNKLSSRFNNLYAVKYKSAKPYLPDSLNVEILRAMDSRLLASKSIPVLEIGQKLVLDNILFENNSAEIQKACLPVMDQIVQMMKARPSLHIRVLGHSDSTGAGEYNFRLSQRRAMSVQQYISESGIDEHRIEPVGMGKDEPIASNDTEVGRQLNRRTEFIITSK